MKDEERSTKTKEGLKKKKDIYNDITYINIDRNEDKHIDAEKQKLPKTIPLAEWKEMHPDIEPSPFQRLGKINSAYLKLWKALTGEKEMPFEREDFKTTHLIPTRQFRKDIVQGNTDPLARKFLWNYTVWTKHILDDLINIMEKER
jgi:hypothetical protein